MQKAHWKAAVCGAAAGTVNGLFGTGGGLVLVLLFRRLGLAGDREIFASALGVMLPVSAVAFGILALRQGVDLRAALPYCLGGAGGGILGGLLLRRVPTVWLHRLLGVLILWGGIRMLR